MIAKRSVLSKLLIPVLAVCGGLVACWRLSFCIATIGVLLCGVALVDEARSQEDEVDRAAVFAGLLEALEVGCVDCHQGDDSEAGLDFEPLTQLAAFDASRDPWRAIRERVEAREMPPKGSEFSDQSQYDAIVESIDLLWATACRGELQPGPTPIRRLTRHEYSTTVRDLLGIHFDPGHRLPVEGGGGEGFDNAAEILFLSPIHAEQYLEAAREAIEYAARDQRTRQRLLVAQPSDTVSPQEAARQIIMAFGRRAFRRPLTDEEAERFVGLFAGAYESQGEFEAAIWTTMRAMLVSPHFLFRMETPNHTAEARPVTDYELATRLSYFLWSTMPDEELLRLAGESRLHEDGVLKQQVERMLRDPKSLVFGERFVGQWLGTEQLGKSIKPDPQRYGWLSDEILSAVRYEPAMLWQGMLAENRPLTDLIHADYAFLNNHMVRLYGIQDQVTEPLREQPLRVKLPEGDMRRGGVLTSAAVLMVTSYPNRTSPVLRGKWLLENLLDRPPPPPPPNVPELEESEEGSQPRTVRARLEEHRKNPVCASCHDRIDPIGFAFENYDPIGRWREDEEGQPIDSRGDLLNRGEIDGIVGLKQRLLDEPDLWVEPLIEKTLGYALGRGLSEADLCTVQHILDRVRAEEYRSQALIMEIVNSPAFRLRAPEQLEPIPAGEPEEDEKGNPSS